MYFRIGKYNVTELASKVATQGAKNNPARTLTASILQAQHDVAVPKVKIMIGDTVTFKADGHEFYGIVFDVLRASSSETIEVVAFDMCMYTTRNKVCFKAKSVTPEAMAKSILSRNGIPYKAFERTNYKFTHTFFDATIYDAIMTGYGYASTEIGEKYIMHAEKTKICVRRKGAYVAAIIKPKQNLVDARYKMSAQNAINRVEVRNDDGELLKVYKGEDTSYGICTEIIRTSDTQSKEAKKLLEDGKVEKTATVTNMGNPHCVTGNAVVVEEPHTGMHGLFYIEGDTHTWQNGIYQNKLTLNYRNVMDKASVLTISQGSENSESTDGGTDGSNGDDDLTYRDPDGNVYEWD